MKLIQEATKEKLRGGFYTPQLIADFILKWGINGNEKCSILEPSSGDGAFLSLLEKYNYDKVIGIEFDDEEAEKCRKIDISNKTIYNADFHEFCETNTEKFDLIIGNPPYIRFQYFNKRQQELAKNIYQRADLKYSKLSNAWVSFVVGSSLMLKEKGKIGFVLPAEILQVSYAKELRKFLAQFYNKICIVSFEKLVFPSIQQEVVLLLCEKNGSSTHMIDHVEVEDANELSTLNPYRLKNPQKKVDFKSNKWTFYFLQQKEIDFLEKLQKNKSLSKLGDFANIEVGMTTGANPFFTVPQSTVNEFDLEDFSRKMVGRSVQVKSLIFNDDDWKENNKKGARSNILIFPKKEKLNGNHKAKEYIKIGEDNDINKGYKCRIREEWQIVPSVKIPEALFIRRNNLYPRLIINEANAYTTDTMHRAWMKEGTDISSLVASYYNSISLAYAEVVGRSHGGGVLELMPNEAEEILLPYLESNKSLIKKIDKDLRNGKSIIEILKYTNKVILKEGYGFSDEDIEIADSIRLKLSSRRLKRGKKN